MKPSDLRKLRLEKGKHLANCPFYPLGADCTCGLGELDKAITDYEHHK